MAVNSALTAANVLYDQRETSGTRPIKGYIQLSPFVEIGETMVGGAVSEVVSSNVEKFAPGDLVFGYTGWQDYALAEGALAAGCRFFAGYPITPSTETAESGRLDEARIKELTGGDKISARFLHGEFFTFDPTFISEA